MASRFLLIIALTGLPLQMGFGQSRIGDWRLFTSTISPQALVYHEGRVYMATGGGVLIYDVQADKFFELGVDQGLRYTDLSTLAISGEWLWLGGAKPRGLIQIMSLLTGEVHFVDLNLEVIDHIVALGERAFAAFRQGQDGGILELRWDGQRYSYTDNYRNFPFTVTDIRDLDVWGDSLFVTTATGVLGSNFVRANLKDPLSWERMTPFGENRIVQYHVDSTGHYYMVPNELYRRDTSGWVIHRTYGGGDLRHLMRRENGDFVISYSRYLRFLTSTGSLFASPMAAGAVLSYADGEDDDIGYVAIKDQGLARYHHPSRSWTPLAPNTMAGKGYSAVLKLASGDLVAAGSRGITRFNGTSWYNLMPGFDHFSGPDEDRINESAQVVESRFFLADTIYFRGKQSWNILELPSGEILVGFKGNPHTAGSILKVDLRAVANYETYDTTGGRLDGLLDAAKNFVFITVRHLAADARGNIWIANPFSPLGERVIAVLKTDGSWSHFSVIDSRGSLNMAPTEIAFDAGGRVWMASEVNSFWGSTGGIAVLDYGPSLDDRSDDVWTRVSARLEADHSNTVWSLVFDHNQVLWTVTPNGVMGYTVDANLMLRPFTNFGPYLSEIPFVEGSKIRVDTQNNKWITTPQHGLWVILDNTTFWPSVDGFNTGNSPLPSDEILDIFLDDEEGIAYLATSKGLAALKIPFKRTVADYSELVIYPSPYRIPPEKPGLELVVAGLRQGSQVKIFTLTGRLVRELSANEDGVQSYQARWDGRDSSGEWVGSGVYLIAAFRETGGAGVGKVAVIRR